MEYHICGTHVHIDQYDDIVKQHALITASDPVFSLMSGSPFFKGVNHLKDYRVKMYRDVIFSEFPLNGALLPYVKDKHELDDRITKSFEVWMEKCKEYNVDQEGFTRLNTCWGPVRLSEKETIESRSCDTNLFSKVMALAAFYAGLNRQLDSDLELPDYSKLKHFEKQGISQGLEDKGLNEYLSYLVQNAEKGLEKNEVHFLEPFKKSLIEKRNFSDEITEFVNRNKFYRGNEISDKGSVEVRKYISQCFVEDLYSN